jgi:hypothetical protein
VVAVVSSEPRVMHIYNDSPPKTNVTRNGANNPREVDITVSSRKTLKSTLAFLYDESPRNVSWVRQIVSSRPDDPGT